MDIASGHVIHKYDIPIIAPGKTSVVMLPRGAVPVSVGEQHGRVVLWAAVVQGVPAEKREFLVVGTDWEMAAGSWRFIGTVSHRMATVDAQRVVSTQYLVWHVFERAS